MMKATPNDHVIADSDDIVQAGGYAYFPASATQTKWLEKAERRRPTKPARMACNITT